MANVLIVAEAADGKLKKTTHSAVTFARTAAQALGGAYSILVIGDGVDPSATPEVMRGLATELAAAGIDVHPVHYAPFDLGDDSPAVHPVVETAATARVAGRILLIDPQQHGIAVAFRHFDVDRAVRDRDVARGNGRRGLVPDARARGEDEGEQGDRDATHAGLHRPIMPEPGVGAPRHAAHHPPPPPPPPPPPEEPPPPPPPLLPPL